MGRETVASKTTMLVVGAVLLIGLLFIGYNMFTGGGGGACPPGQTHSAAHGPRHRPPALQVPSSTAALFAGPLKPPGQRARRA